MEKSIQLQRPTKQTIKYIIELLWAANEFINRTQQFTNKRFWRDAIFDAQVDYIYEHFND